MHNESVFNDVGEWLLMSAKYLLRVAALVAWVMHFCIELGRHVLSGIAQPIMWLKIVSINLTSNPCCNIAEVQTSSPTKAETVVENCNTWIISTIIVLNRTTVKGA